MRFGFIVLRGGMGRCVLGVGGSIAVSGLNISSIRGCGSLVASKNIRWLGMWVTMVRFTILA